MNRTLATAVVVVSSAAVLVLEIVSIRLAAPFSGDTLETYTASIGVALAAIALGAKLGGDAADRTPPARLIGPVLLAAGVLTLVARPLVLLAGPWLRGAGPVTALLLVAVGIAVPVALLSAVPPLVVKTQLATVDETGTVVGRISAVGTVGSLAGTFLTGYVLIAMLPVSAVLAVTAVLLLGLGLWFGWKHRTPRRGRDRAATGAAAVLGAALLVAVPSPCDSETAYFCARVAADPERETGRSLYLDDLRHGYVDLADPAHLEIAYVRWLGGAVDALAPRPEPVHALHAGGGAFTLPRWVAATRPGSYNSVIELDPAVAETAREELGLRESAELAVRTGDARTAILAEPSARYDLVVGDAFGGPSVPWHLTTAEFAGEVRRVLAPGGAYLANVIDHPPLGFLGAEIATLRSVFGEVALVAPPERLAGEEGGNFVVVAGDHLPDRAVLDAALAAAEPSGTPPARTATTEQIDAIAGASRVLTDDYAPVDQLVTPYRTG
ncbi:fused MFS/spermidine synthase [Allonocardiopsis opalescens]|uniref:Spermidine synthase n=1 Tax=Allonocardiopsis opalescens TaxID=1144618 RepID=A0A2T0PUH7_9ACTN|nr:fused MFS/spermidine synthase [Allonocardiopsis opalescens]PRX92557.1 hypothetical protein CLV72_110319 [Allonocardiopsis opalescens]